MVSTARPNRRDAFPLDEDVPLFNVSMSDIISRRRKRPYSRKKAFRFLGRKTNNVDGYSFLFFPGNAGRGTNGSIKYLEFGQSLRERDIRFDFLSAVNLR